MGIEDETDVLLALIAYLRWQWLHSLVRYKRLEKSQFCWPRIGHNRIQLNHAQLLALIDGMDWKRVRAGQAAGDCCANSEAIRPLIPK
ncbi:IS66 family insertion sequence element accessory protein TnpB [Bradyrhizobium sp. BRP14]|nr:IS66 family insertion sequence element accessory protein TnpB [Bradyrhizobium sp. BRP14]